MSFGSTISAGAITTSAKGTTGAGAITSSNVDANTQAMHVALVSNFADSIFTGTITVTDAVVAAPVGNGALLNGASTAGSLVAIQSLGSNSSWVGQITGLTSGTLYFEGSVDSTTGTDGNWVAVNGRQLGIVNTVLGYKTTTNGAFRGNCSDLKYLRIRAVGALTGTPAIILRISPAEGALFLNASIPAGTNLIGSVGIDQTTPGTSNGIRINDLSYPLSVSNNSTTQLASATSFTGTLESVLTFQAAQIAIVCDQAYTVNVLQYNDAAGLQLVGTDSFIKGAGQPLNENVTLPGNYFKLQVTNNGVAATTTLVIAVTFGIMNTEPHALTALGNLKHAMNEVSGAALNLGQQTMAASLPVALASNQGRMGTVQLTGGANSQALGLGATITAYGSLRTTAEPVAVFNDPFDGSVIDTVNRWNTPVLSGMNVTQASGGLTITTNLTASAFAFIDSQPTFAPLGINFQVFAASAKFEVQAANFFALNQHRFFGTGSRPGVYATGTPYGDAIGFEIDITGQLSCVVYQSGTLRFKSSTSLLGANLNTLITPSGGYCRFGIAIRADTIIFYVNSTEYPAQSFSVTSAAFTLPDIQALPIRIAAINAPSGTVGASTFVVTTLAMGDTGGNGTQVTDGVNPFIKTTVKKASVAPVASDNALVVAISPNSMLAMSPVADSSGSGSITTQNLNPNAGTATAGSTVASAVLNGAATASLQINGTYTGTLTPQITVDGVNWISVGPGTIQNYLTGVTAQTIPNSATGIYIVNVAGAQNFRVTATTAITGTAAVTLRTSTASSIVSLDTAIPTGANTIGSVKITDGTNLSTFKAASTVAVATDTALVVAISPNNTVGVSVVSQPEISYSGTITTTDIVVPAPAGNGVLVTGTPTAGSYASVNASGGNASAVVEVTGLTSGTLWYEGSVDSTTGIDGSWISLNLKQAGIVNTQITQNITSNGLYRGNTAGIKYVRVRSTGTLSGTPLVVIRLSAGVAGEFLFGSIPTGTNIIGSVKLTDGTNTGTIKASNTPAVATDTAIVVALSPNNSLTVSPTVDTNASASITTQNLNPNTGVVTAGSTVSSAVLNGASTASIQVTGIYSGVLTPQITIDGVNWIAVGPVSVQSYTSGVNSQTIPNSSTGIYIVNVAGAQGFRVTATTAMTGTATTSIRTSLAPGIVSLDTAIPTGANTIGSVTASQSAVTTGNIVAAGTIIGPVSVVNANLVAVTMSGTYAGVSNYFEATSDGVNWIAIQGRATDGTIVNGFTGYTNTVVAVEISLGAWTQFRVRTVAWTSGSAAITIITKSIAHDRTPSTLCVGYTPAGNPVYSFPPLLMGGTDGTNARMAVFKAPSVAAVATDPALVVAISPNSPIPTGANTIGSVKLTDGTNVVAVKAASTLPAITDPSVVVTLNPNSTPYSLNNAATTNASTIKAAAGTLFSLGCTNNSAATVYLKLYNLQVNPTVGTSIPIITYPILAGAILQLQLGTLGMRFTTGIALALTGAAADSDATALGTAAVVKIMASYN